MRPRHLASAILTATALCGCPEPIPLVDGGSPLSIMPCYREAAAYCTRWHDCFPVLFAHAFNSIEACRDRMMRIVRRPDRATGSVR